MTDLGQSGSRLTARDLCRLITELREIREQLAENIIILRALLRHRQAGETAAEINGEAWLWDLDADLTSRGQSGGSE